MKCGYALLLSFVTSFSVFAASEKIILDSWYGYW